MAKKTHDFSDPDGYYTTSLRIPNRIGKQIVERATIQKRSVNSEIALMLEKQIDSQVKTDQDLIEKMRAMGITP